MKPSLCFPCPECDQWTRSEQVDASAWPCSICGASVPSAAPTVGERVPLLASKQWHTPGAPEESAVTPAATPDLTACRCCGNPELYVQKDFPHWLGMGIIAVACLASVVTLAMYWIVMTWVILLGSAVIDVVLYSSMGDVTICYRCQAQYRGFSPNPDHKPFELAVGEKYRQEQLRREQLK